MKVVRVALGWIAIAVTSVVASTVLRVHAAPPVTPVVVELFTSEGCSSCPPADVFLEKLIATQPLEGVEIVALGEHVDYWDQQGWKDRFSSSAFTARQQVYGSTFSLSSVYTPQMVVDGRAEFVGTDAASARRALERARSAPHGTVRIDTDAVAQPRLRVSVTVSGLPKLGRGDRADVLVAVTEDQLRSDVTRGENHGRVLTHAAVVRRLETIGEASAEGASTAHAEIPIAADWQRDRLKIVAFVQERRGRGILASASTSLARR